MNKENYVKGIMGGFIGSLIGVVAIVFFYKLGYVAAAAGIIMSICTINFYKKFAGEISKKGIFICIGIMLVMTFVGYNFAFSMALVDELKAYGVNVDVFKVFFRLFSLMSEGMIVVSAYLGDLAMLMLFSIAGSVGVLKDQFKKANVTSNPNNQVNYMNANNMGNTQNSFNSNYNNMNNSMNNNSSLNNNNNNPMFTQNQSDNNIQNNMKNNNNTMM